MDIKLKRIVMFVVCLKLIQSCNPSYTREKFEYRSNRHLEKKNNIEENFFNRSFRDGFFYSCLSYGYRENKLNDSIFALMDKKDLFSPSDDPNPKTLKIQDSLAKVVIDKLPSPYLHIEDENSIKGKNFIISTCLCYYESNELDSIAQKLYKEKVKQDKKIWGKETYSEGKLTNKIVTKITYR